MPTRQSLAQRAAWCAGRFFAARFRAGTLYAIYERTGDSAALDEALKRYRTARDVWAKLSESAKVYAADITVGEQRWLRGHWSDRLAAIDADIADMAKAVVQPTPTPRAKLCVRRNRIRAAPSRR